MNTKIIMAASAITLGAVGIVLTFIPDEILILLNVESERTPVFLLQIVGALYLGFGMLNWMNKTNRIGGIYNRPVAIANLMHFLIAGLALTKGVLSYPKLPVILWVATGLYIIFGLLFAIVLYSDPIKDIVRE